MTVRGGAPEAEIAHGKLLLQHGAPETWGWSTPAGQARVARRVEWITRCADLKPGSRVLECGCGTGIFTRGVAATGADITAVDISADLLSEAARLCPAENVQFRQINLEKPDELADASFDAIYGVSVLHHLNLPAALPQMLAKLKPGGRFVFSEPNLNNPINKYYLFVNDEDKRRERGISPTEMAFTSDELRGTLEDVGFRVLALDYRDFMHPRVPAALIPMMRGIESLAEMLPLVRGISGSLWVNATRE